MVFTKKLWLLFAIILLVVAAVGVSWYRYRVPAVPKSHAMTTLFVDAGNASVSGNLLEIPIAIDTGGNTVSVVELHLGFDAKLLTGVSIQPGNFFSNPMIIEKTINAAKGTIVFTLGSLTPRRGVGVIATITALLQQKTPITIHIVPKTRVAAISELGSVLNSTRDGTVQVP